MNKNINKSCRYCITAFAAVTDRKLSLQGSVISWKWGVSGMLVIWDHVFSNSTSFSIVCSENCSCPCTPQVGAEGLIQGQRSLQTPPAPPWWVGIKLCHCSGSLWGSWTPPEAVETRGQAWPEQKGWPWKAEHFHLLKIWLWKDLDVCQLPFNLQWLSDGDNHKEQLLVLCLGGGFEGWTLSPRRVPKPGIRQAPLPLAKAIPLHGTPNLGPEGKHSQRDWTLQPVS